MEQECLLSFKDRNDFVLATGGGTPCYFDNMKFIRENGVSIYLELDAKSIFHRLIHAKRTRPTIAGMKNEQLTDFIAETLKKREPVYLQADHIVQGINTDIKEILKILR
jgi:shikimate kinase